MGPQRFRTRSCGRPGRRLPTLVFAKALLTSELARLQFTEAPFAFVSRAEFIDERFPLLLLG
jgi:hypothetical protein